MYQTIDEKEQEARIRAMMRRDKTIWFITGFFLPLVGIFISRYRMRRKGAPKEVRDYAARWAYIGTMTSLILWFFVVKPFFFGQ